MKPPPVWRAHQRGFSLLELLAALLLLAVSFFVVMGGIGQAARALRADESATRLALAAQSIFDNSLGQPLQEGRQQGHRPDGVTWQLDVTAVQAHAKARLYRLDLTLTRGGRQERLSTLRAQGALGALR